MSTKGRKFPPEPLTRNEAARLLRAASADAPTGIRNRAVMTVMYRAGLRIAETLNLKPSDISPDGTVRVLHGKNDRDRVTALDDAALTIVQRWTDRRTALGIKRGPLFCTLAGGRMHETYVRQMMGRYARRAGLDKRVHPHGLRHSCAAEMVAEGIAVNVIQDFLGHGSLATTNTYLKHVRPADVIAACRARTWNLEDS